MICRFPDIFVLYNKKAVPLKLNQFCGTAFTISILILLKKIKEQQALSTVP